jgi:hypothetical protein
VEIQPQAAMRLSRVTQPQTTCPTAGSKGTKFWRRTWIHSSPIDGFALRARRFADYYTKYYRRSRLVTSERSIAHG